jgi:hypothetical protein
MWRKRTKSLGGILNGGRTQNLVAEIRAQLAWCPQVDFAATKQPRKLTFHAGHSRMYPTRAPGSNSTNTSTSLESEKRSVSTDPKSASRLIEFLRQNSSNSL